MPSSRNVRPASAHDHRAWSSGRAKAGVSDSYLEMIGYSGFNGLQPDAKMLFPGTGPELIRAAMVTAGSSGGVM